MLKRDKDGLYYVSNKTQKRYELDLGFCIDGEKRLSSDICYILDSGLTEAEYFRWRNGLPCNKELNETFVGFFYGGTFLTENENKEEYTNVIKEIVDVYESKIEYAFTEDRIFDFRNDIVDAAFDEVINKNPVKDKLDIKIQVGNRYITVPYTDNNYIGLYDFLRECRKDKVDIKSKTIDEMILDTLNAYKITNEGCLTEVEVKDLEDQIEYMKQKIKEEG